MNDTMVISFVVPAYRASETIGGTLRSVFKPSSPIPEGWRVEVVVVDDGSPDCLELRKVLNLFPKARLVTHDTNRGMCAGRNTGIKASTGDIVTILDADDALIDKWPDVLCRILCDWPEEVNVCFSACRNLDGEPTVSEPKFMGLLTFEDLLNERHTGEYLPLFKGSYIRNRLYVDLGMRRSCGIVSYFRFAEDGPFWVTPWVLRIYNDRRTGSVTSNWTRKEKAAELVQCYEALFERYGNLYLSRAPRVYRKKRLQYSVYLRLAGREGAWKTWWESANYSCLRETIGALMMLTLGRKFVAWLTGWMKRFGMIKRYG